MRRSVFAGVGTVALVASSFAFVAPAGAGRAAEVAVPDVTGPVTGGRGTPTIVLTSFDLADVGYVQEEYFVSGPANVYAPDGVLASDGRWKVTAVDTAPFTTRIVVHRPESADDFSGTVFVEWVNVSAGFDTGPDWLAAHTQMIRSGAAWIGVSAQAPEGIEASDPERYAALAHPGDAYSYDIFAQVGVVARNAGAAKPLGDAKVERVIAMGESQSAFRMVTYINARHSQDQVYDGFLVHSRGGSAAGFVSEGLEEAEADDRVIPDVVRIRRDVDVPVLTVQTESDVTLLGSLASRQPDTKRIRLWEIAGTAHSDSYTTGHGFGDIDQGDAEHNVLDPTMASVGPLGCDTPINAGPAFAVLNAAVFHLERWVKTGTAPPRAPRLSTEGDAIVRDEHDNAEGGIRTPFVDVPIATNNGEPNDGGSFCRILGRTIPFDAATLAELYPTHDDYVDSFAASADRAVDAGFWLETDAEQFKAAAAALPIPS